MSCRVLFVLVPVVVSVAGTDGGVCCNGLRCVEVALTPALLSPSAPSVCPSVPFASALCPCLWVCSSWIYLQSLELQLVGCMVFVSLVVFFVCFFCDGGVFIVLFGGLGCVVLVYFERDWLLIMNFKKM